MFVLNFKLDIKKIVFGCILIALALATIIKFGNDSTNTVSSKTTNTFDYTLTEENYVDTLKTIHENLDENIGKTVQMNGYVYRMPDFKDNYFVCGRDYLVNNENNVAGFLCYEDQGDNLLDNEWIEITGVIAKGEYNGETPVLKVNHITKITAPANTYVQ